MPSILKTMTAMPSAKIHTFLAVYLAISATYIISFTTSFSYPTKVIALHFIPIALTLCTFYLITLFINAKAPTKASNSYLFKMGCSLFLSIYLTFFLVLYGVNWIANLNWGSNIIFDFLISLPRHIQSVAIVSGTSVVLIGIGLFLTYCFIFFLSIKIAKGLIQHQKEILVGFLCQDKKRVYKRLFAYLLLLYAFFVFYLMLTIEKDSSYHWTGEPVVHLFSKGRLYHDNVLSRLEASKDKIERNRIRQLLESNPPLNKPNVILMIADSLRADHMRVYGYERETTPNLTALKSANKLEIVKFATSTCSESACGIVSSLASRRYKYIGLDLLKLPDLLNDAGYKTKYILSSDHSLSNLRALYGYEMDLYHDGRDHESHFALSDDQGVVEAFKNTPDFTDEPTFLYFHLMSPHILSPDDESFLAYQPAMKFSNRNKSTDHSLERSTQEINAYDNGVLQTDYYISELLILLEKKGYLENAMIVILGDHGEGLGERGNYNHTYHLYQEDINIPIIFYSTDRMFELKQSEFATQIDIAPTILDYLDIPIPNTWQGTSLLESLSTRVTLHQTWRMEKEVAAILDKGVQRYKLMASLSESGLENFRLYNLNADPGEQDNIYGSEPAVEQLLKEELKKEFSD